MGLSTLEIARLVNGRLTGPEDLCIDSMQSLEAAGPHQLSFISDAHYAAEWPTSRAGAAIVDDGLEVHQDNGRALIRVANVDLAVAAVLEKLAPPPVRPDEGIHESAVIDSSAQLGADIRIGPHCYVGRGVKLGVGVVLQPGVTILDDCEIGDGTTIWPGAVVRERCVIGSSCILHPNVTIGADGFGYRPRPDGKGLFKIPQIGNVVIGNHVEIGAGTCIDRAKLGATIIGDMSKIDNLCQIAHNCRIGRCVIIAGCCGIAGSVTIGDGAVLGGSVGVKDHLTIGAGATVAAYSALMHDVPPGETWAGYPAKPARMAVREYACMSRLPELVRLLKKTPGRAS